MVLFVTIFTTMMKDSFLNKKFKYSYNNAYLYLILANVLVFILEERRINGLSIATWLSLSPYYIARGWVWQFFTYMFVHAGFQHLFFNMLALLMFGRTLERYIGTKEFLLFYFLCGMLGGVVNYLFYLVQGTVFVFVFGASGAIYALLFLCAVLFPTSRVLLFFFIPVKMPYAVLIFTVIEVISQVFGLASGVAHLIHLSCMAIAWVYVVVRFRVNPIRVWKENL